MGRPCKHTAQTGRVKLTGKLTRQSLAKLVRIMSHFSKDPTGDGN